MGHLITTIIGLFIIGVLVWLSSRVRSWAQRKHQGQRSSRSRVMSEAEILTRGKGPFV